MLERKEVKEQKNNDVYQLHNTSYCSKAGLPWTRM